MKPSKYTRKTFVVEAIQVTEENIEAVAQWCQGTVLEKPAKGKSPIRPYIKVRVHHPLSERQTEAYVGDWVLYAGSGYKVYTAKAFPACFDAMDEGITGEDRTTMEFIFRTPSSEIPSVG